MENAISTQRDARRSRSLMVWTVVVGLLLVPIALSSGSRLLALAIFDLGLLFAMFWVSHRNREQNKAIRSTMSCLALAILAVASWKYGWTVRMIVFGGCSILFAVIAISESTSKMRRTPENDESR